MVSDGELLRCVDVRSDVTELSNSSSVRHGPKTASVGPLAVTFDRKLPDAGSHYKMCFVGLNFS